MKFSEEEKNMWLDDWQRSGKSAWAYARENGLCQQTFIKWTKQRKVVKPCFVEVPIQKTAQELHKHEILIEKGSLRIHIPLEPVLNELYDVIARLGQTL